MSARAETLAKQFEAQAAEMTATLEKLSDADWKKVSAPEGWSVGVIAHHVAGAHEPIAGLVKRVAAGKSTANLSPAMLHEMNAKHAREHADCTRADTLALHAKGVAAAAAVVRGLSDAELDQSGGVLEGVPAMTTQQAIENVLIGHIKEHLGSIRSALGR